MASYTKMTLREKMIGLGILIVGVLLVKYSVTVAKIFWALCEGAAGVQG